MRSDSIGNKTTKSKGKKTKKPKKLRTQGIPYSNFRTKSRECFQDSRPQINPSTDFKRKITQSGQD